MKYTENIFFLILYLIGISLLIFRTYDITHITIKNGMNQYHSDYHLLLLFIGSLFVFIYATYHHIWPLSILTIMNMYQASIFYYKIHFS